MDLQPTFRQSWRDTHSDVGFLRPEHLVHKQTSGI